MGPLESKVGEIMKEIVRRIAVVVGAAAVSAGLMAATAIPATSTSVSAVRDSSWGH